MFAPGAMPCTASTSSVSSSFQPASPPHSSCRSNGVKSVSVYWPAANCGSPFWAASALVSATIVGDAYASMIATVTPLPLSPCATADWIAVRRAELRRRVAAVRGRERRLAVGRRADLLVLVPVGRARCGRRLARRRARQPRPVESSTVERPARTSRGRAGPARRSDSRRGLRRSARRRRRDGQCRRRAAQPRPL